jgi:hypothetical protein
MKLMIEETGHWQLAHKAPHIIGERPISEIGSHRMSGEEICHGQASGFDGSACDLKVLSAENCEPSDVREVQKALTL